MYFHLAGPVPHTLPRRFGPGFFPPISFPPPTRDESELPGSTVGMGLLPHEVAALALMKKRKQNTGPGLLERLKLRMAEAKAKREAARAAKAQQKAILAQEATTRKTLNDRLTNASPGVQTALENQRQAISENLTPQQQEQVEAAQNWIKMQSGAASSPAPSAVAPSARAPVAAMPTSNKKKLAMAGGMAAAAVGAYLLFS